MEKAYRGTEVNWVRSQKAMVDMLKARGIYQTRFTNLEDKFVLEFLAPQDEGKPIAVRVLVPFVSQESENKREQELNRMHRVLFYHLKAKFVSIDEGLKEFMQEFMDDLVVMDKNGNSSTMGQMMLPQYKNALESGEQKEFKLLEDGE